MKLGIVADGESRVLNSFEFELKRRILRRRIEVAFSARLAAAGFFQRWLVRFEMEKEYRRELRRISPSSQALYISD
jgi:hypothetical protein